MTSLSRFRVHFYLAGLSLGCLPVFGGANIPAGTDLQVRLTTPVSSSKPAGSPVSAVLIAPVLANGAPVIAAGVQLSGTTADVNAGQLASAEQTERPATLRLQFTRISDLGGHSQPLAAFVYGVDNARESVDSAGLITGITASQTYDARIDQGINKLSSQNPAFANLLSGVKSALLKPVDASIDYPAGVELTVRLNKGLDWNAPAPASSISPITGEGDLAALVNAEPSRTVAQNPPKPSDLTNIMFIGTAEQLQQAFQAAGWTAASALSRNSKFETARAIIENRGYSEAPVSVLYLGGNPPDFTFQKQNDTFDMRHHIRIWRRPDEFHGKPVWVAAGTHDTSITFSQTSRNFTHGIDPNIDRERSKIVNDMLFTGDVHGLALVKRTLPPGELSNATGDKLITDGSMAVLEF